ncbi:MAG: hypothetical protein HN742_16625 [Lentisphaerae bacterium]|jgi:hypothetical protein|nr:hypothetical protein [Lentisphaerota bacterium]MBT4819553.1 hypothetical protein [Lentisphaerota bacterium]MBT5609368.1 hypothetical protein [Lentisphaerota bacterium]MBT7060780.1 hypothetical protein [Lentisphaerota bacterium]MBT7843505.1 hypothetical protein [Lentisphaerota bacterium]
MKNGSAFLAAMVCMINVSAAPTDALRRRAALQQQAASGPAAVPALLEGLKDENVVVRRTAARLLTRITPLPVNALATALTNSDGLVRRLAISTLVRTPELDPTPYLETALSDPSPALRLNATQRLAALSPRTPQVTALLARARQDRDNTVARTAAQALWTFHRSTKRLSERPDWDYEVRTVKTIPLPAEGWHFRVDPRAEGHLEKWFRPELDDSSWRTIAIEQAWQKAGVEYTGVSWYRRSVDLPAKPELNATEIRFEGVDESTWVWVNGVYVGDHDIGPDGWNEPFSIDVTAEIKWGATNQITVRAMSTQGNGGIWKPVSIQALK